MARNKHASLKSVEPVSRKSESIPVKKAYLIACEGECTEPNYIKSLVRCEKSSRRIAAGTVVKIAPHQHSNPYGVFTDLISAGDLETFDECWIVIDRDEIEYKGKGVSGHHEKDFLKAVEECKKAGVNVACSNPCFELWIVLHFEYRDTACSRGDIQSKALEKINSLLKDGNKIKNVDALKAFENLYDILRDKTSVACKFAKKLSDNAAIYDNPSTGVYELVNSILKQEN